MPSKSLKPCNVPGCPGLTRERYCTDHAGLQVQDRREAFARLDAKKTDESRAFYNDSRWHKAREAHRRLEPLCRSCQEKGIVTAAEMVHHSPEREILVARGDSPYDHRFLVSLCNKCHLGELRKKRSKV
jgi:5-methylcytosine-specific restriction enzyme A